MPSNKINKQSTKSSTKERKQTSKSLYSKAELQDPNLVIKPLTSNSSYLYKENLFSIELDKYKPGEDRQFIYRYTVTKCPYFKKDNWPGNIGNLSAHYRHKHPEMFRRVNNDINTRDSRDIISNPDESLVEDSTTNIDSQRSIESYGFKPREEELGNSNKRRRTRTEVFSRDIFISLCLDLIKDTNQPFRLVESQAFRNLVDYLRPQAPTIGRLTLSRALDSDFTKVEKDLIRYLGGHDGLFNSTIDEWKSRSGHDYLCVTINFYTKEFFLESFVIAFEELNNNISYTGNILFKKLDSILKKFNIRERLLSITRDNAGPCNTLVEELQTSYNTRFNIDIIDISCAVHNLNLVSSRLLKYLFFIPDRTIKFSDKIKELTTTFEGSSETYKILKELPAKLNNITTQFNNNHFLKNTFRYKVKENKKNRNIKKGPKKLLRDIPTRQLSIFNKLDRTIELRPEITSTLAEASAQPNRSKKNFKLESYTITDFEQTYIIFLRDILLNFRAPTIKFQANTYTTVSKTIPYITRLLTKIDNLLLLDLKEDINPFLVQGLKEAREKLLEYYPIYNEPITPLADLYLTTVLNLYFKLAYFEDKGFKPTIIAAIKEYFIKVYNKYKARESYKLNTNYNNTKSLDSTINNTNYLNFLNSNSSNNDDDDIYPEPRLLEESNEVEAYLREAPSRRVVETTSSSSSTKTKQQKKLDEEERIEANSVIFFYKNNSIRFPIITKIALDYLSINTTSVPSESTFSRAGDIVTKKRTRLLSDTVKKLVILKVFNIAQARRKALLKKEQFDENKLLLELNDNIGDFYKEDEPPREAILVFSPKKTNKGKGRAIDTSPTYISSRDNSDEDNEELEDNIYYNNNEDDDMLLDDIDNTNTILEGEDNNSIDNEEDEEEDEDDDVDIDKDSS